MKRTAYPPYIQVTNNKSLCSGSVTIRSLFEDYLFRPTYPIVTVDLTSAGVTFDQRASNGLDLKWDIPIFVQDLATSEKNLIWLRKDGSICNTGKNRFRPNVNSTYVFNAEGASFVRVDYSNEGWSRLITNAALIDTTTQYAMVLDLMSGRINKYLTSRIYKLAVQ